jgi:hypothetical protein
MIDNILADHLLLSDSRLERRLLRCSQKGGDDGAGGNSGSLVGDSLSQWQGTFILKIQLFN